MEDNNKLKPPTKLTAYLRKRGKREASKRDKILKLRVKNRSTLVKENPDVLFKNRKLIKKTLRRASSYLIKQSLMARGMESCRNKRSSETRVDDQVRLRCRQLPNVVHELRKSIMRQDWNEAATLVMILCHPGLNLYSPIIIRTCFLLLFNHPSSNYELLENFIRNTTGYVLEEDINKFIRILFALRSSSLNPLESGKYARKTGDYKVTRDLEFAHL